MVPKDTGGSKRLELQDPQAFHPIILMPLILMKRSFMAMKLFSSASLFSLKQGFVPDFHSAQSVFKKLSP